MPQIQAHHWKVKFEKTFIFKHYYLVSTLKFVSNHAVLLTTEKILETKANGRPSQFQRHLKFFNVFFLLFVLWDSAIMFEENITNMYIENSQVTSKCEKQCSLYQKKRTIFMNITNFFYQQKAWFSFHLKFAI